jgi:dsDNA-specific endonuclease/ATPase MutS2
MADTENHDEAVPLPVDGTLDLHPFHPSDLGDLVPDYLEACRQEGIMEVRIIHGKGIGNIRRSVHAILERLDYVESFSLADATGGHWGATLVNLKPNN